MRIVDAQLHEPSVWGDWEWADQRLRWELMLELQLSQMNAVGVDSALLFAVDLGWARFAAARHPGRFAVVPMFAAMPGFHVLDAGAPDIERIVEELSAEAGVVAVRIVRTVPKPDGGVVLAPAEAFDRLAASCARAALPMFMSTVGDLATPGRLAARHAELTVIVDHLGLPQPPSYRPDATPFAQLPKLLALAEHPNVVVKCSGAPTLSREGYPFADLWPHLRQVIGAFGVERVMWGSDFSRVLGRAGFHLRLPRGEAAYEGKHTYAEALHYVRDTDQLTPAEKTAILGETAHALLHWPALL